jgi:hypothetical protein
MLDDLERLSKTDARLGTLLDEVREFTLIYVLAKQRHRGCAGTGELMSLREEYKDVPAKLKIYVKTKATSAISQAMTPKRQRLRCYRL